MCVVKIERISKIYESYQGFLKKRRVLALKELNLEIRKREVFGLLGLNAAGKSTLLKLLLEFIFPTRGEFEILGERKRNIQVKTRIGFLPEEANLYNYLSAEEFLDFCGRLFQVTREKRKKKIVELLKLVGLENSKKIRIKEFSRGMRQRLGIASALINDPEIVFLDEPMSGLDPQGRKKIKDIIFKLKERGKSIFFSSHILAEVEEICDRIGILHKGRLICLKEMREIREEGISLEKFFLQTIQLIEK